MTAQARPARSDRVILMDRDGTLVVDRGYLADPAGLEFLPGAAEGLRQLHARGHRLIIISNQSGIGRGLFSWERLEAMHSRLRAMVGAAGAELAGIYCCPHRPEDGCDCRKPGTALVEQAARELHFDPAAAIVIGDRACDVALGQRLGATTIRIASPAAGSGDDNVAVDVDVDGAGAADHTVDDLLQAARLIEWLAPAASR